MQNSTVEASYPLEFREEDAKNLGELLRFRHSVELVGMKHVGIGNFLSFFLYQSGIVEKYVNHGEKHLFIAVDLNDLVEREIYPFWILVFKRVADRVEDLEIEVPDQKEIAGLFLQSIQSQDLFLTIENLRKTLNLVVKNAFVPTIFLLRLDRLKEAVNEELFGNLQGLVDATGQKLAFVFTSFRSLDQITPVLFEKKFLSLFSHKIYIRPSGESDTKIIFETFKKKYGLTLPDPIINQLLALCGGHVQYLQLSLIILNQKIKDEKIDAGRLLALVAGDERVNLLSEEIWESLSADEQQVLKKIRSGKKVDDSEKNKAQYLWETGIVLAKGQGFSIFNPLFEYYLSQLEGKKQNGETVDFTKKENLLFNLLSQNLGGVCEREKIINAVWPEYEEQGVSDWTIDRLVARLRTKLKKQDSKYSVVTVRTRGYKLVEGAES